MKVLAFDPGKVTGWAFYNTRKPDSFIAGQLEHMPFLDMMDDAMHAGRLDVAVGEAYTITARSLKVTRGENWSLEQLGVVRWLCHRTGVEFAEPQTAAAGKRFGTDAKLKRIGWYQSTVGGHRNDACRHLLTYLADHDQAAFMVLYGREETS